MGAGRVCYNIAVKHAETTMKYHFRQDYTCYHVAVYDPEDGHFIKGMTHQGYSDSSTCARGQAWAIYGYTTVYRETQDKRFLDFAEKVTDAYRSGSKRPSFLDHSTGHKPAGSEIDYSIIYADYYYIEALLRYKNLMMNA